MGQPPHLMMKAYLSLEPLNYKSKQSFHGQGATKETFEKFSSWLNQVLRQTDFC